MKSLQCGGQPRHHIHTGVLRKKKDRTEASKLFEERMLAVKNDEGIETVSVEMPDRIEETVMRSADRAVGVLFHV